MRKRILEISAGIEHPSLRARWFLHRILAGGWDVQQAQSIEGALRLTEGGFDAAVVYLHRRRISDAALDALEDFVTKGGGLLGIHSATASFKQNRRWFELMGGRFVSHAAIKVIELVPRTELFALLGSFHVRDELYVHELRTDITVHYLGKQGDVTAPIVWTRAQGSGRVCYLGPGHLSATLANPDMVALIRQALKWVCKEEG